MVRRQRSIETERGVGLHHLQGKRKHSDISEQSPLYGGVEGETTTASIGSSVEHTWSRSRSGTNSRSSSLSLTEAEGMEKLSHPKLDVHEAAITLGALGHHIGDTVDVLGESFPS